MRKLALLLGLVTLAGGCATNACEDYVGAALECYDDAGQDPPATIDLEPICGDDDAVDDEVYACWAEVYQAGDCSEDGLPDLHAALAACQATED